MNRSEELLVKHLSSQTYSSSVSGVKTLLSLGNRPYIKKYYYFIVECSEKYLFEYKIDTIPIFMMGSDEEITEVALNQLRSFNGIKVDRGFLKEFLLALFKKIDGNMESVVLENMTHILETLYFVFKTPELVGEMFNEFYKKTNPLKNNKFMTEIIKIINKADFKFKIQFLNNIIPNIHLQQFIPRNYEIFTFLDLFLNAISFYSRIDKAKNTLKIIFIYVLKVLAETSCTAKFERMFMDKVLIVFEKDITKKNSDDQIENHKRFLFRYDKHIGLFQELIELLCGFFLDSSVLIWCVENRVVFPTRVFENVTQYYDTILEKSISVGFYKYIINKDISGCVHYSVHTKFANLCLDFFDFKKIIPNMEQLGRLLTDIENVEEETKTVKRILKKSGNVEELLKSVVMYYHRDTLGTIFSNYLEHKIITLPKFKKLDKKYLSCVQKSKKDKYENLQNKYKTFFKLKSKEYTISETADILLKYLVQNNNIISEYFVINEELEELTSIKKGSTLHINEIYNLVTYFYE